MTRQPILYTPSEIKDWDISSQTKAGKWVPARPLGHNLYPILHRWKLAYLVLTGKADALYWGINEYD